MDFAARGLNRGLFTRARPNSNLTGSDARRAPARGASRRVLLYVDWSIELTGQTQRVLNAESVTRGYRHYAAASSAVDPSFGNSDSCTTVLL